jgi:signal transduction histidine kinase
MIGTSRRHLVPLAGAILALIIGMVSFSWVLWRAAEHLSNAMRYINDDAVPSLIALESSSSYLRQLQSLLEARLHGAAGDLFVRDASIARDRKALEDSIGTYLSRSVDPGEAGLGQDIRNSLAAFEQVDDRVLALPGGTLAGRVVGLERDLDVSIAQLDNALLRAGRFNAEQARRANLEVATLRREEIPVALAFGWATDVAAIVAMGLVYRALQRNARATAEKQALLERRAGELESFAGRVAHDLLSPLTGVGLAMSLAERRLSPTDDARVHELLSRATASIAHIRWLVNDLLDFARAGAKPVPGARARVDQGVRDVANTFRPIAEAANVELIVEPPPELVAGCSVGVLASLLSNLVQNAIKFLSSSPQRRVEIRGRDTGGQVRVEVQDTGPGISGDPEQLFEPYVRGVDASAPGLGLGLATVKRLAESHGGYVGVLPAPGGGSVFWFSLPKAV